MSVVSSAQRNALYSQHSLNSHDWQTICQLASLDIESESQLQQIASLTFEQFFGLAVHSFITTENAATRQQLATLLPKFGSRAVLSLFKVLLHCDKLTFPVDHTTGKTLSHELRALSIQSLNNIEPTAFVLGLEDALSDEKAADMMPLIIDVLVSANRREEDAILTLLPRLLSANSWQQLKKNLLAYPTFSAIQTSIQAQQRRRLVKQAVMKANPIRDISLDYLSCQLSDAPTPAVSA